MGSPKHVRTGRSHLSLLTGLISILFLFSLALPEKSHAFLDWLFPSKKEETKEKAEPRKLPSPAKSGPVAPSAKNFTIAGIEPDPAAGLVKITFTEACYADNLRNKIRIFPPVQIDWNNSHFNDKVVLLRGNFRNSQDYTIAIPEETECKGYKYVKTINTFKVPDLESGLQFIDPDTVIERDSRQMLHVKVTNVEELVVQSLGIPPLLVPAVIKEIRERTGIKKVVAQPGKGVQGRHYTTSIKSKSESDDNKP